MLTLKGIRSTAKQVNKLVDSLTAAIEELTSHADCHSDNLEVGATHCRDRVIPAMAAVRDAADQLERLVPGNLWPLPTYRDMLFLH